MSKRMLPQAGISARPGLSSRVTDDAFKRWNPDVRAAVGEADATITILDQIGEDYYGEGVSSKRIAAALRAIGDRDVTVVINSPGGNYFEGLSIYNLLREHKGSVTVKIVGIAASAASVIAMAGDTIKIARAGFLMIHNAWVIASGNRHSLRDVADWLEPFDATAVDIYHARTGIDGTTLAAMLDREAWIGGKDAIDQGFADDFLDADEIDASQDAKASSASELRAERRLDQLLKVSGISRSEQREIVAALKGGKPGAAPTGTQDAAISEALSAFLTSLETK
jgi:ATP-dependent Clp protease, protease subunit